MPLVDDQVEASSGAYTRDTTPPNCPMASPQVWDPVRGCAQSSPPWLIQAQQALDLSVNSLTKALQAITKLVPRLAKLLPKLKKALQPLFNAFTRMKSAFGQWMARIRKYLDDLILWAKRKLKPKRKPRGRGKPHGRSVKGRMP